MDGNDYNNSNHHRKGGRRADTIVLRGTRSTINQDIHAHMGLTARPCGDHPKYL
jgi:hypothetical protein